ncbi:MAG: ABC transporter permease [Acidobacteria bacterium]|nr:MAG: ABC transporter permease [Acidobacteriota bacterium]
MARPALVELTLARIREFVREPEAVFWVFVFPVLLALALGLAFRERPPEPVRVGLVAGPGTGAALAADLAAHPGLDVVPLAPAEARLALARGRVGALIERRDGGWILRHDPTRPESRLARLVAEDALQREAGRRDPVPVAVEPVHERGGRYIDFLVPGLLGMNLMGTGMWGIGFNVVQARSKQMLKRLGATPMRRADYLLAQVFGRLFFLPLEVGLIVGFSMIVFGVPLRGSPLLFTAACLVGAFCFSAIGLLVAARPRTIEGVSGLMNFVMLPMWIGSGIFFSTSRFPEAVQPLLAALPLTAVIDALRAVMLDGAGPAGVARPLAIAAGWGIVSLGLALPSFRWR